VHDRCACTYGMAWLAYGIEAQRLPSGIGPSTGEGCLSAEEERLVCLPSSRLFGKLAFLSSYQSLGVEASGGGGQACRGSRHSRASKKAMPQDAGNKCIVGFSFDGSWDVYIRLKRKYYSSLGNYLSCPRTDARGQRVRTVTCEAKTDRKISILPLVVPRCTPDKQLFSSIQNTIEPC
jgi:hypothetical protein